MYDQRALSVDKLWLIHCYFTSFAQEQVRDELMVCRICEEAVALSNMLVHSEECTSTRECANKAFESDKQLFEVFPITIMIIDVS